jgi:hypothetical protein
MTLDEMIMDLKEKGFISNKPLTTDRAKLREGETTQHKDGMYIKENGKIIPLAKSSHRGENKEQAKEKSRKGGSKVTEKLTFQKPKNLEECRNFKTNLINAKASCDKKIAWRVDTTHKSIDYKNDLVCTSKNGSVAAVTKDGDVISVCANQKVRQKGLGTQLIQDCVKNGGKKLDSFDGNFEFYVNCGFEPVSWCYFEKEYAPDGWNEYRDKKEPVIFFKYVGVGNVKNTDLADFYYYNKPAKGYDEAKAQREKEM